MKYIIPVILFLLSFQMYSQRKPKIKGNKNVTEVREELPPFNAIELNDDLEIFLQKSPTSGYTISADDNLIDVLKFKVVDSTLIITSFYKIVSKKKLDITINYKELESITLKDGKMMTKDDIVSAGKLYVNVLGFSKLELNANAPLMNITMEGNSTGNFNLDSDSLTIALKDRADVRIYSVSEKNIMEMHQNASAQIEGTTDTLQVNLFGNASLRAEKLEAATVKAHLEESPSAKIYAFKDIELSSKGSSKTYLYGNPKIAILEFLDTSVLFKKQD